MCCKLLSQVVGFPGDVIGVWILGVEGVGSVVEHDLGEMLGGASGLDLQVAKHGIRSPASQEAGDGGVDVATEEGSGAPGAKGAGGDFVRGNSSELLAGSGRWSEEQGDVAGRDGNCGGLPCASGSIEGVQRSFRWSVVLPEADGES